MLKKSKIPKQIQKNQKKTKKTTKYINNQKNGDKIWKSGKQTEKFDNFFFVLFFWKKNAEIKREKNAILLEYPSKKKRISYGTLT